LISSRSDGVSFKTLSMASHKPSPDTRGLPNQACLFSVAPSLCVRIHTGCHTTLVVSALLVLPTRGQCTGRTQSQSIGRVSCALRLTGPAGGFDGGTRSFTRSIDLRICFTSRILPCQRFDHKPRLSRNLNRVAIASDGQNRFRRKPIQHNLSHPSVAWGLGKYNSTATWGSQLRAWRVYKARVPAPPLLHPVIEVDIPIASWKSLLPGVIHHKL
jgi:hypothetical protein